MDTIPASYTLIWEVKENTTGLEVNLAGTWDTATLNIGRPVSPGVNGHVTVSVMSPNDLSFYGEHTFEIYDFVVMNNNGYTGDMNDPYYAKKGDSIDLSSEFTYWIYGGETIQPTSDMPIYWKLINGSDSRIDENGILTVGIDEQESRLNVFANTLAGSSICLGGFEIYVTQTDDHNYVTESRDEPTCEENGYEYQICSICLQSNTVTIPKLGHNYDGVGSAPATCISEGEVTYTCSRCGDIDILLIGLDPANHVGGTYEAVTTPVTCEADGVKAIKCTSCNEVISTEPIEKLSHSWVAKEVIQPTATTDGYTIYKCQLCGAEKQDDITPPVTPPNHNVEFLQARAAEIRANGLSQSHLVLSGNVLTLVIDGREFVLSTNANNRNISGEIPLGDGCFLKFDIKGNGSNIKQFEVVKM
jgi:DNA-directed RNA polymerase subunit RPC12/RpoP